MSLDRASRGAGEPCYSRRVAPPAQGIVWIVDDGPDEAEMAKQALSSFSTRTFLDAFAMLEQLAAGRLPDVLVLDWMMPQMSGIEVCKLLRTREATSELPILLLTAQDRADHIGEGLAAGANDYVSRPYVPAELIARVGSLLHFKRLRERADKAQRSMRALLSHLPDALITTSETGLVTFLNAEAERILSTTRGDLKGQQLGQLFPVLATIHGLNLNGDHFEALPEFEAGGRIFAPAARRMTLDGVSTIAVTLRDVTEKRRMATRRLDFYSMVAHDLRSPLTAMTLRLGLMKEQPYGPLPEPFLRDLDLVDSRIGDLVLLINDFLDIARSEGVGITLTREPIDLVSLVRGSLVEFAELAQTREVRIRFDWAAKPVDTHADPARLTQVITNLVSNAVKFSSSGGEVVVEVARREADVEFAVSDAGGGIAEDKISELFKRYSRPTGDSAIPGTGLGLMVVREIVAAHAGTCGVESVLGKGSRFWFRLPHASTH